MTIQQLLEAIKKHTDWYVMVNEPYTPKGAYSIEVANQHKWLLIEYFVADNHCTIETQMIRVSKDCWALAENPAPTTSTSLEEAVSIVEGLLVEPKIEPLPFPMAPAEEANASNEI